METLKPAIKNTWKKLGKFRLREMITVYKKPKRLLFRNVAGQVLLVFRE